jgi:ubiquinone/menaquinone biosynthesis C-methylase UbiE
LAGARHATPDFGAVAASYDRLRPVDEKWWELFELLVREGELLGRRVLDIGCGTGTFAVALAARGGGKVWGIDDSPEMLAEAEAKDSGVRFKRARAESLPFKDAWFDRAVMRLSLHLLDRPEAFSEAARILVPGGRLVIASFDPEHFSGYWLNELFPSLEQIDRARFPGKTELEEELRQAGFGELRVRAFSQEASATKKEAIERIRGRYISTLRLLGRDEFERGLQEATMALPERIDYRLEWLVMTAVRPGLDAVRLSS